MAPRLRGVLVILLLALSALQLAGCASVHRGYESMLLLGDVRAGDGDSRLKAITADPERSTVSYTVDDRDHVADVYRPGDRDPRGTLVLIHGFTEHGRRDPRLEEFATSMARSGFVVVTPDVEGPKTMAVGLDDARDIGDTLEHVTTGDQIPTEPPVGVMAFSFAVGPSILAAKEPRVADSIGFLVAVGGYYDLVDAITYVTTGYDPVADEQGEVAEPRREGKWVVLLSQLDRVDDERDRELLRRIAERRIETPWADMDDEVEQLGDEGAAVYALITNTDPGRVEELLHALPDNVRHQIQGLDLAQQDLSRLQARLVLVHGTDDNVIPFGHSERLGDAVGEDQARLFAAAGLHHVDVSPGLRDGWQLWRAAAHVLALADQH